MPFFPFSFFETGQLLGPKDQLGKLAVLYYYNDGGIELSLNNAVEAEFNRQIPADNMVIVCPSCWMHKVESEYSLLESTTKGRILAAKASIYLISFSHDGKFLRARGISKKAARRKFSDEALRLIIKQGFDHVIKKHGAILAAPPGHVFLKGSGGRSVNFVRAANMFREPAALSLISHGILRALGHSVSELFIDSFTILPAVMAYQGLLRQFFDKEQSLVIPQIINFHSYAIRDTGLNFPADSQYRILISASTSGGLLDLLVSNHGARASQAAHLLFFGKQPKNYSSVHCGQTMSPESSSRSLSDIRIIDEEFIASSSRPVTLEIRQKNIPKGLRHFCDPSFQEVFSVSREGRGGVLASKAFLDVPEVWEKWVEKEVACHVPASAKCILSLGDFSGPFAQLIQDAFEKFTGNKIPIKTDLRKLSSMAFEGASTVIVTAEPFVDLKVLSSAAQQLRANFGHRHYILPALAFSDSYSQAKIISNLSKNYPIDFGWSCRDFALMGPSSHHDSWSKEAAILGRTRSRLPKILANRKNTLSSSTLSELFFPSLMDDPLFLREQSILFGGKKYENVSQVIIYIIVCSMLQDARELLISPTRTSTALKGWKHLGSPFAPVALDPNTFSRFNDGVIQASFLRAAFPSELNYKGSPELSSAISKFILDIIDCREFASGEACIEFVFAVASGRIGLCTSDFQEVEMKVKSIPKLKKIWRIFNVKRTL